MSPRREAMPSFVNTLPRCHSTVRGLRNSSAPISASRVPRMARAAKASGRFNCALITPSETAFVRMPRDADPIASDVVAATRPPLVSEASP